MLGQALDINSYVQEYFKLINSYLQVINKIPDENLTWALVDGRFADMIEPGSPMAAELLRVYGGMITDDANVTKVVKMILNGLTGVAVTGCVLFGLCMVAVPVLEAFYLFKGCVQCYTCNFGCRPFSLVVGSLLGFIFSIIALVLITANNSIKGAVYNLDSAIPYL